jgi:hypothetical protein
MEKRKYLYNHLKDVDINKNIIIYNYIVENICDYYENNNGLLLNLSTLQNIHIDKIYDLYNMKETKINYCHPSQYLKNTVEKVESKSIIYKKYDMNNLEKRILSYS